MDFLSERKLKELSPDLHTRYTASVFGIQGVLTHYQTMFPAFTDHTYLHSMQLIDFCNRLLRKSIIDNMNADELYILLMSACLHDSGMGISEKDYDEFTANIDTTIYFNEKPSELAETIRRIHNELSASFVMKYRDLFDVPTPEHAWCIAMVSRGHRKVDLMDENVYPAEYTLPGGGTVRLAFISAIIRLVDEMDLCADRNLMYTYDLNDVGISEYQKMCYRGHMAVKKVSFTEDSITYTIDTDETATLEFIEDLINKLRDTLKYCREVVAERSPFVITQNDIHVLKSQNNAKDDNYEDVQRNGYKCF